MKRYAFHTRHLFVLFALMGGFAVPGAYAATITAVPAVTDSLVGDGACSLREAVLSVNAGMDMGDCVAVVTDPYGTNDTIMLQAGIYRLSVGGLDETAIGTNENAVVDNTPDASIGDLDLLESVQIIGAGSGNTRIEWDPAANTSTTADRIFHIYTTDINTANIDVVMEGVTLASGQTFEVDLGANTDPVTFPDLHYYFRRAGGALALGAAANVVEIDTSLTGSENANAGGLGGSTGGESGATDYTLALTDVIVDGNSAQGDGGGLYIAAPTTATYVVLSNNLSMTNGGGIYNEAFTIITNSTISGNKAEGGGGIFLTGSNTVSIAGSTFSGNRAIGGGAISGRSGVTINVVNSTVSGNLGEDVGAGFYANGPASLSFVTIANNIAGADAPAAGSGINAYPSGSVTVDLENVLLDKNKKGWDPIAEPNGPADPAALASANCGYTGGASAAVISSGHNLSSDTSCMNNLYDTSDTNDVDPMIGALAANGGPTMTHALLTGSPALGGGSAIVGVSVDQRGITRDATPDIGAYEVPTPPSSGGSSGGCAYNPNAPFDPVLLVLLGIAIGGLYIRRRCKDTAQR